jgi:hypothetical protein
MPLLIPANVNSSKLEIAGGARARPHTNPNRHCSIVSLLVDPSLPMGGNMPQSEDMQLAFGKPRANDTTSIQREDLP